MWFVDISEELFHPGTKRQTATYRQFNRDRGILTCIVQAKWLSSCGIVSQLSVTTLFHGQVASNLPAVCGSAAAGAQVPYAGADLGGGGGGRGSLGALPHDPPPQKLDKFLGVYAVVSTSWTRGIHVRYSRLFEIVAVSPIYSRLFEIHYKKRGRAQIVHYQRMHVVSKVSKRFPRYTWEISWTPWKLRAFSGSVQVAHSLYSCSDSCRFTAVQPRA